MKDIKIQFSEEENREINLKITDFVKHMKNKGASTDYYKSYRKAVKPSRDILLGKKGEFFAAKALNIELTNIDLEIRRGNKKGWVPDLSVGEINYHVKTCNKRGLEFCGDYSWTFQVANIKIGGGTDDLFKSKENNFIVLVYMEDVYSRYGVIKCILPWEKIKPKLRDPISSRLKGLKLCLYYKDLINVE
jgi:hypothetical protein